MLTGLEGENFMGFSFSNWLRLVIASIALVVVALAIMPKPNNAHDEPTAVISCSEGVISTVVWSPDGACGGEGDPATVQVWNTNQWEHTAELEGAIEWLVAMDWSPDGSKLAGLDGDNTVYVWDMETFQHFTSFQVDSSGSTLRSSLVWSSNSRLASVPLRDGEIQVWDVSAQEILANFPTGTAVTWSPDSSKVAIGYEDGSIQVVDVFTSRLLVEFHQHTAPIWSVAWNPETDEIASFSEDGMLQIWDSNSGETETSISGYRESPLSFALNLAWNPDGTALAGATIDGIYVWDPNTGQEMFDSYVQSPLEILHQSLVWSPDGQILAVSGGASSFDTWYGKVWFWNMENYELLFQLEYPSPDPLITWNPDGSEFASTRGDGNLSIWDVSTLLHPD
jgi:WD40 repeat protein